MAGIQNFLQFIEENWVSILVCIGLIVSIVRKTIDFFSKPSDEQVRLAKDQISQVMLKLITDAEVDYEEWDKAGSIKRSQVIGQIYKEYPILSKIVNQSELIEWIDNEINNSLKTLREIIKQNGSESKVV